MIHVVSIHIFFRQYMGTSSDVAQQIKKNAMVKALEQSLGVVTTAAKSVGIERSTHYDWMKDDEVYRAQVEALKDVALDFAESKLHNQINKGDTTATIFYLKTQGKRRGYIEKTEVDHSSMGEKIGVIVLPGKEDTKA